MGDKVFREMIEKMRSYRRALIQHACVSMCPIMVNSCDPMEYRAHLDPLPMELPSKNTGKGCQFLLQGIFPTTGIKPAFPAFTGRCFTIEQCGNPIQYD